MNLVDTHCHLDFDHYDKDRSAVLEAAWEAGVSRILVPGIDVPTSQAAVKLANAYARIYAAVGVHPNSSESWDPWTEESLEMLVKSSKVVAVGEIGLDYYRQRASKSHQKEVFQKQLALAQRQELPVVIHTRNASSKDRSCISDLIHLLSLWDHGLKYPGVIHSFSGNLKEAWKLLEMGFYLGVTGPVTYKNAAELREVVTAVPLDRLLIETDGPFLSPQARRGRRNEPSYVSYIAEKIADLRSEAPDVVANQIRLNAARLFKWDLFDQGIGRL